ncbi:hypothetical protein PV04_01750 [Phialophora macrospora]|uniref:Uncharacterized protein n=1 Tax=Phialophora macrospora TaxID=1851006 RepID=A0A0D2D7V1_9EURO|nr:hypothetical protein PV04_01750 [Phialophora macrospora]
MQLRSSITTPTRLQDEESLTLNNRNGTKPAHPGLMKANVISFNSDNPPAAFPSLPLTSKAPSVGNKDELKEMAAVDTDTKNPFPKEGSLAGITSDIHSQENSEIQTSHINVKVEQGEPEEEVTQEGGVSDNVVARAGANRNEATGATSPTTAAQTASSGGLTVENVSAHENQMSNSDAAQTTENQPTAAAAMPTASESQANQKVKWSELTLSLQYHIYEAACSLYPIPPRHVAQLLRMNATQFAQMQHAVGLRALHPACLKDLWAFCAKISVPFPGLHPDVRESLFIDPDIFNEYADYLTFACKYDCAFEGEVRLGAKFLSDYNLAPTLMGQWLPDPDGSGFFQFTPYVPGYTPDVPGYTTLDPGFARNIRGRPVFPLARAANASGPPLGPAQSRALRQVLGRPGVIKGVQPTGREIAARNALRHPALLDRPGFPSDPAASAARTIVEQRLQRSERERHPLAQVSTPGEVPSRPQPGQSSVRQTQGNPRREVPQTALRPVPVVARNLASRRNRQSSWRAQGSPSLRVQPTATTASKTNSQQDLLCGLEPDNVPQRACSSGGQQKDDENARDPLTSGPTAASLRLVLKIDDKDGSAKVLRKTPSKAADTNTRADSLKGAVPSDEAQSGNVGASNTVSSAALPFGTTMSGFSRDLVMGLPSTSTATSSADSVFAMPVTRAPANRVANPHPQATAAIDPPKRKASQSDIRPDGSKAARMQVGDTHATPARGLVPAGLDDVDRLHCEAKKSYETGNVLKNISGENSTPTKVTNILPSTAGVTIGTARPLPSPTFSAISENADLPEFQALLGPVNHRLRVKVPAVSNVASDEDSIAPPTPSSPVAELHLLQNISTPTASERGETAQEDTGKQNSSEKNKKKPQKLKLIVGPRSQTSTPLSPSQDPAAFHGYMSKTPSVGSSTAVDPSTSATLSPEATEKKASNKRRSSRLARMSAVKEEKH